MNPIISRLMANKHTSGAAVVYGICMLIANIATRWFPEHAGQIAGSMTDIKEFAVLYGFIMAGDSRSKPDDESGAVKPPEDKPQSPIKTVSMVIMFICLSLWFLKLI
jgi:hypothetical protein